MHRYPPNSKNKENGDMRREASVNETTCTEKQAKKNNKNPKEASQLETAG